MSVAGPQNWFLTLSFCCPSPLSEQCPPCTGAGEELLMLMAALSPCRHPQLSKHWTLGLCCAPAHTVAGGTPRMRLLFPALVLALLATTRAAEVTRGDVFALPEDDYLDYNLTVDFVTDEVPVADPTEPPTAPVLVETTPESKPNPEETLPAVPSTTPDVSEEPEELCSGKPFDAFTDLKNGSLYAFRGKYFYELDKTSVRPGYPKLISDVWGIEGPIDAAFTRINCQGKTYLFKGSQYWRFDDGALDPGYPRDISEGFEGIPDNVDAAFALPAHSYHGNERVYFFKDKYYWSYDFAQQPTQADCEKSSPSTVFKHYAFMNRDSWEDVFQILFGSRMPGANGPWYISRDWRGVPSRLDAAMAGRIYVASHQPRRRKSRRQRKRC
uniref:Vitronectin n=1 Tax=Serinus canaria TaxID=9135 RepID=A0A8C9UB78_SERCA